MLLRLLLACVLILLTGPLGLLADTDKPTVAFLRYGGTSLMSLAEKGILDMLEAYDLISAEERVALNLAEDLNGENLNVLYRDAGFDLPTANIMVEDVIDRGADVLVTLTTPVTQIAANITREMDDPPALIFAIVTTPYFAGIADAPCIKDKHIAGTQTHIPYEEFVSTLKVQDPDLQVVGTIFNHSEPNSVYGAEKIAEYASELGMRVEKTSIVTTADLQIATDALLNKGVEAIAIPAGLTIVIGLPTIVETATEYGGVPVFSIASQHVYRNATVGAGFYSVYREGVIAARMLIGHLNDDIDLGRTAVNLTPGFTVAINLDTAAEQDVEISAELLAMADWVIENGESTEGVTPELPEHGIELQDMPIEARRAADLAFLAEIYCTDEMISAQKRQLETQWTEE